MRVVRSIVGIISSLLLLSMLNGCRPAARAMISDDIEVKVGEFVATSMAAEFRLLDDTDETTLWARQLVGALAKESTHQRDYRGFGGYKVQVIDDAALINAFAAPGGFIFLSTGLILEAKSCSEIAGVLGHELAHVTKRHGVDRIADMLMMNVGAMVFGINSDLLFSIGATLVESGFSRAQEREADVEGLDILIRTGYNPRGMIELFDTLEAAAGTTSAIAWFSSHPDNASRKQRIHDEAMKHLSLEDLESEEGMGCVQTDEQLSEVQERLRPTQRYLR